MRKYKNKIFIALVMCLIFLLFSAPIFMCEFSTGQTKEDIKLAARRASVQPVFYIPVIKATFTNPIDVDEKLTKEDIENLLEEKIKIAIEKEKEKETRNKYNEYLTNIDVWGYEVVSQTHIPLGALAPKWAKFPERVLVVYKTEKKEITAWEKEYEKDILAVSETANVSPSQAKEIINRLHAEGYSISKEKLKEAESVELLWFEDGWNTKYPQTLKWSVETLGTKNNIIIGYDSRGILEIQPVADDARLHVVAGYFDLKDEYKPKSDEVKKLESQIEMLQEDVKDKQIIIDAETKKKETKRDISNATYNDVRYGTVKLEEFWMMSAASGVFLGNMKVTDKFWGFQSSWGSYKQVIGNEEKGVILTNAHVANMALSFKVYVSEDKEEMWVVLPGVPYIRYTQDTDLLGSPAQVLWIEGAPVSSLDFDCALMVTTKVPEYDKYKVTFGNSDNVKEGEKVIMVGNPTYMQKFLTEGVITNKSYNLFKSLIGGSILWEGKIPHRMYRTMINSDLWFDTPIGIGGTSGSGVWALEGSEKGKMIALHNMGLRQPLSIASAIYDKKDINVDSISLSVSPNSLLKNILRKHGSKFFEHYPFKEAKFRFRMDSFIKKEPIFGTAMKDLGLWVNIAGMNAGVPINKVKQYLQERGISPEDFNWEELPKKYWKN